MDPIRLSDQCIQQLCIRARQGCESSRGHLLEAHKGLVVHVANYFFRPGAFLEMEDLIQQGRLGLLRAIEKFDPERVSRGKRVRFSTYAHYWISHCMRREIENHGRTVAIPIKRLRALKAPPPADLWLDDDAGQAWSRLVDIQDSPERWCRAWEARREVEFLLSQLAEKTRVLLSSRFGLNEFFEPMTQKQAAERMGVSGTQIGVLERAAIKSLRSFSPR